MGESLSSDCHLDEGRSDAVKGIARLNLCKAEVDFGFGSISDVDLLYVRNHTNNVHVMKSALTHRKNVADGVLTGQIFICEGLIDYCNRRRGRRIIFVEESTL